MVLDLKDEKVVDCLECAGVGSDDADATAPGNWLKGISNNAAPGLHDGDAGRHGVINEHGELEVAFSEHPGDVGKMSLDGVAGGGVIGAVGDNFNGAAIEEKAEVVGRFLMKESHGLIAAGVHAGGMGGGGLMLGVHGAGHLVLRSGEGRDCQEDDQGGALHRLLLMGLMTPWYRGQNRVRNTQCDRTR